jgi:hypothetical protein
VALDQLDAIVGQLRAEYDGQPIFVAVDYVQLAAGNGIDVRAKNADTVEIIRRAAKRLRVVILAVSQPSRAAGNALRKGEMVGVETMGANAETAGFERGAYVTMAIGATGPEGPDGVKSVELNIGKARMIAGGGDRILPMRYNGRTGLWQVAGASRPAADVQADRAAAKDERKVQAAKDAMLAAADRSPAPLTREGLREAAGVERGIAKCAIEALLEEKGLVECENATRSKSKLLWTPGRRDERDIQRQARDAVRFGVT